MMESPSRRGVFARSPLLLLSAAAWVLPLCSAFLPTPQQWAMPVGLPELSSRVARSRGVITSLVINPKRKGITSVSIEDIKAKKATLAAPLDLHGRVLITGSLDEEVCSLLNDQRVWTRITVMSQDPVAAKKRLTSRTTRYSGVLDLLHFQEGNPHDLGELEAALSQGQYCAWLDINNDPEPKALLAKAKLVTQHGLKYFVSTVALSIDQLQKQDLNLEGVNKVLKSAGVKSRILVTGPVFEAPATGYVRLNDTTFLQPNATITRGDLARIATEFFLVTEKPEATAIYASQGDEAVIGYLRYCREQGYDYKTEIEDQLQGGLYTYKERVAAQIAKAEQEREGLPGGKLARKDSDMYAEYRVNVTKASIAQQFEKKRRTLVGMVKKIVSEILEEEYDDMYYSMRTKQDLDLYKRANWQRAVGLVLEMLMSPASTRPKEAQKLTGFQDPYLGPQWHVIRANAAVVIKIKELYDEIGDRLEKEDWEKYDMLQGDFLGDEEAVLAMKIEEKTKRNKHYLRDTLLAPPRKKSSLVVEAEDIETYKKAALAAMPAAPQLPSGDEVEEKKEEVSAAPPKRAGRKPKDE